MAGSIVEATAVWGEGVKPAVIVEPLPPGREKPLTLLTWHLSLPARNRKMLLFPSRTSGTIRPPCFGESC